MPPSASRRARRVATMVAILRPTPMSTKRSSRLLLPVQRISCCQTRAGAVGRRQRQALGAQRLRQHLLAQALRLLLLHVLQVVPDLGARPAGADEVEPGRVRARVRRADDLDDVAALQLGAQRHRLAVDVGRDAVVADVGVDRVGEVDRRRAARQGEDLRLRREDVDRVGVEVDLDVLEELAGVARLVLDVDQRLQPEGAEALRLRGRAPGRRRAPCRASARRCPSRRRRASARCGSGTRPRCRAG